MHFSTFILPTLVGLLSVASAANSVACDKIEKYSLQYFLDNVKPEYKNGLDGTAVFYSQGQGGKARAYAKANKKVTIWDMWSTNHYWIKQTRANPLKCIMGFGATKLDKNGQTADELKYFENMSQAVARLTKGEAQALHINIEKPPTEGIWARIEEKELMSPNGKCTKIVFRQADLTTKTKDHWVRAGGKKVRADFDVRSDDEIIADGEFDESFEAEAEAADIVERAAPAKTTSAAAAAKTSDAPDGPSSATDADIDAAVAAFDKIA